MPANRREPVSVPFWFQSIKRRPHGGLLQRCFVGAGHARESGTLCVHVIVWERAMPATNHSLSTSRPIAGMARSYIKH